VEVIPAVDIMKGKVVRLVRGDPSLAESYEHLGSPIALAKRWEADGARIIHVVDLDAALGRGSNIKAVRAIVEAVKVAIQVGGGIRSLDLARNLLESGASRVVLGSLAFEQPPTVESLLAEFGDDRLVVALDNLDGVVMVHGWKMSSEVTVDEAVQRFSSLGARVFLVTSVARDGTMTGPDLKTLARISGYGVDVIAAGGIGSLEDLVALKRLGVYGAVVGKALYEGAFSLSEALRAIKEE